MKVYFSLVFPLNVCEQQLQMDTCFSSSSTSDCRRGSVGAASLVKTGDFSKCNNQTRLLPVVAGRPGTYTSLYRTRSSIIQRSVHSREASIQCFVNQNPWSSQIKVKIFKYFPMVAFVPEDEDKCGLGWSCVQATLCAAHTELETPPPPVHKYTHTHAHTLALYPSPTTKFWNAGFFFTITRVVPWTFSPDGFQPTQFCLSRHFVWATRVLPQ